MENGSARRARVLVVEDSSIVALELALLLGDQGIEVVGPFGRLSLVQEALAVTGIVEDLDAALLDINLDGACIYPLAEFLIRNDVPVLFLTGYNDAGIDERYRQVPRVTKPYSERDLLFQLESVVGRRIRAAQTEIATAYS